MNKVSLLVLIAVFILINCGCIVKLNHSSNIIGTWKMVVEKPLHMGASMKEVHIKTISKTHFPWVSYLQKDKMINNPAGGQYELNNGVYTEYVDFATQGMNDHVGKANRFKVKIKNGQMTISGTLYGGRKLHQVWSQIK